MKNKFSTAWIASKQPRKQRKYVANAPLHIKRKFMSATLSKELRAKHGIRSLEIRKNDEAEVMRGKLHGKKGKVIVIDMKKMQIAIENLQGQKKDGTKTNIWFHPSNVRLISLVLDDKMRLNQKTPANTVETKTKKVNMEKK